ENGRELPANDRGRASVHSQDAFGILCGDARNDACAMHSEGGKRFQVRLNACPAAAVGACDGQRHGKARLMHCCHIRRAQNPGVKVVARSIPVSWSFAAVGARQFSRNVWEGAALFPAQFMERKSLLFSLQGACNEARAWSASKEAQHDEKNG